MLSDEQRLNVVTKAARLVKKKRLEHFYETAAVKTVKHPSAVIIWLSISGTGFSFLYFSTGTMKGTDAISFNSISYFVRF